MDLGAPGPKPAKESVDEIREAFWVVGRSMGQVRVHERLNKRAGVRIDRAGGALLYMLRAHGESVRVTGLAELLGVDSPTVTRKIQQLERDGLVTRHADRADRERSQDARACLGCPADLVRPTARGVERGGPGGLRVDARQVRRLVGE